MDRKSFLSVWVQQRTKKLNVPSTQLPQEVTTTIMIFLKTDYVASIVIVIIWMKLTA